MTFRPSTTRRRRAERTEKKFIRALNLPEDFKIPPLPENFKIKVGQRKKTLSSRRKGIYSQGFGSDSIPMENRFRRKYVCMFNAITEETDEELMEYNEESEDMYLLPEESQSREAIHLGWVDLHDESRSVEVLLLVTEEELREKELEDKEYGLYYRNKY